MVRYYCIMRTELTANSIGKITLSNGREYCYTIQPAEIKNALGIPVATLIEYAVTSQDNQHYKLYKTKDGNWYDVTGANTSANTILLMWLKTAINAQESKNK